MHSNNSSQQSPSALAGNATTQANLKAEIEADRKTLDLLEGEVKSALSSVDEYESLLKTDKNALERMKRDNDAGIEVDESLYETTLRRYKANWNVYNEYFTDYQAKAARYHQFFAATKAKIDRYNAQGGLR